jgi:hypothetical protein
LRNFLVVFPDTCSRPQKNILRVEYFTQAASGTVSMLLDALDSTIGLVNSAGATATSHTYAPFGATTAGGTSNTNPYQFVGVLGSLARGGGESEPLGARSSSTSSGVTPPRRIARSGQSAADAIDGCLARPPVPPGSQAGSMPPGG